VWDVAAVCGALGVEAARLGAAVISVENDPGLCVRIVANAKRHGVDVRLVDGQVPEALAGLPQPDAVFIGGGGQGAGVIEGAWTALKRGGRMVVNAVTLETEAELIAAHGAHGGALTRVSIERLEKIGGRQGFRPAMTVTQWAAEKP
jgi:precorrin-6Y C5,15-methyltransferase (decarboxylating)